MKKLLIVLGIGALVAYLFGRYKNQENVKKVWSSETDNVLPQS